METRRPFYYPLLRTIYNDINAQLEWVVIKSFAINGRDISHWIYDCTRTATNPNNIKRYSEHLTFLKNYESYFQSISSIVFNDNREFYSLVVILDEADKNDLIESIKSGGKENVLQLDISSIKNEILEYYKDLKLIIDNPNKELNKKIEKILIASNIFVVFKIKSGKDKLANFIIWLVTHDPEASSFVYEPSKRLKGGITIALNKNISLPNYNLYRELFEISKDLEYVYRRILYNYGLDMEEIDYKTEMSLLSTSIIVKEYFETNIEEIEKGIRNFTVFSDSRNNLIQREINILFSPLLSVLILMKNVRWLSAFGWHEVAKELYRIDYDIIPNEVNKINWDEINLRGIQFRAFAKKFNDLRESGKLISIGDIVFTKSLNKKPILISFDQGSEELRKE